MYLAGITSGKGSLTQTFMVVELRLMCRGILEYSVRHVPYMKQFLKQQQVP